MAAKRLSESVGVAAQGAQRPGWALHRACDRRSIATVLVALALLLLPQWIALDAVWAVPWILVAIVACCATHVVVHNHCHRPLFVSHPMNVAFNLVASVARGHCVSDVYVAHNLNHHTAQGNEHDWIAPRIGGQGHPAVRLLRFIVRAARSMVRERNRLPGRGRALLPEPFATSVAWEKRLLPGVIALLVWHDWRAVCLFAFLPWGVSLVWLVGVNYVQHEGCDPGTEFAQSRNFTGRWTNWLLFNNGYHTAHHAEPGLHWSETKALHTQLVDRIPKNFNEPSAFRYMIRRYVGRQGD